VLLVGGNGHVVGRTQSEERLVRELRSWAKGWFPEAVETHAWSAQDYSSPGGGVPQVGTLPFSKGAVHYATGFDKWGMTNAVAAARTIAGEILGDRPGWAGPLRPPALDPRSTLGLLTLNARVGLAAVRSAVSAMLRPAPEATPPGEAAVGRAGLRPVAVSAGHEGDPDETCRLSAICTHLGGTLRWNDAEQSWDCPLHGSRFDRHGAVIEGPAVQPLARAPRHHGASTPKED
jgi:nitrite reductase/ring-hydroxylating ferredoxin subunit